jgi:hypothetical protein
LSAPAAPDGGDPDRRRIGRRLLHALINADSYGFVLLLIIVTYVLSVSVKSSWGPAAVLFIQIATVWFALRTSHARRSVRTAAFVLMALAALAAIFGLGDADSARPYLFAMSSLLYFIAPFSIIRHLLTRPGVDEETMLGAIAAYLLFGMFFAFLFKEISLVQDGAAFFAGQPVGAVATMQQVIFFSFTTLTTTGYGNLVPAGNPGQTLAVIEMILGQLFLITAMGKIVTEWRPKHWSGNAAQ